MESRNFAEGPPFVGALLRLCWQRVRLRLNAAIREAGFTDLQDSHLPVFSWPAPEAIRPSDLARRIGMSRQAANHVIGQMEALGYLERRAAADGTRRLIHLTPRGRAVFETIHDCLRGLQADWAAEIGEARFAAFMSVLRHFAVAEAPLQPDA
jgi:DNA-binding MarR family transcriptional regulator